jgi:hypothetical protein
MKRQDQPRTDNAANLRAFPNDSRTFDYAGTELPLPTPSPERSHPNSRAVSRFHRSSGLASNNVVLNRRFWSRFSVRSINFDVRVGIVVPRSFRLFVLPEDLVSIVPCFRGLRFFVFEEEIGIVDPVTFEIVAISLNSGPIAPRRPRSRTGPLCSAS